MPSSATLPYQSGEIIVDGKPIRPSCPDDCIAAGIGLVPEDRKDQGLVLPMPVKNNISMAVLGKLAQTGRHPWAQGDEDWQRNLCAAWPSRRLPSNNRCST